MTLSSGGDNVQSPSPDFTRSSTELPRTDVKAAFSITRSVTQPSISNRRVMLYHPPPCPYSLEMYLIAGKAFSALRPRPKDDPLLAHLPVMTSLNKNEERLCLQLAFETVQYEVVLEKILEESFFLSSYPEFSEDENTVMAMLCDFMNRKFAARHSPPDRGRPRDPDRAEVQIEDAILSHRTKLNAALARMRIREEAHSIDDLLQGTQRNMAIRPTLNPVPSDELPKYVWVNQLKTTMETAIAQLQERGLHLATDALHCDLPEQFYRHPLCHDTLVFSGKIPLQHLDMVSSGLLVPQDLSSCVAAHSVSETLQENDDLILVESGLGITAAHIVSLRSQNEFVCLCFGTSGERNVQLFRQQQELLETSEKVLYMGESLLSIPPEDGRFRYVKTGLLVAACTKSAVHDPINFTLQYGEDISMLKNIPGKTLTKAKLSAVAAKNATTLKHLMKVPRIQSALYLTRSISKTENEDVVLNSLEYVNGSLGKRLEPFRLHLPTVLQTVAANTEQTTGKFTLQPKEDDQHGYFIAYTTREPEETELQRELFQKKIKIPSAKETRDRRTFLHKIVAASRPPEPNENVEENQATDEPGFTEVQEDEVMSEKPKRRPRSRSARSRKKKPILRMRKSCRDSQK